MKISLSKKHKLDFGPLENKSMVIFLPFNIISANYLSIVLRSSVFVFIYLVIYKNIRFSFEQVKQYISPQAHTIFKLFFPFFRLDAFEFSGFSIECFTSVLTFFFLLVAISAHVLINSTILAISQRNNVGLNV